MVTMVNMRMLQQAQQKEDAEGLHAGDIVIVVVVIVTIVTILNGSGPGGRTRIKNKKEIIRIPLSSIVAMLLSINKKIKTQLPILHSVNL